MWTLLLLARANSKPAGPVPLHAGPPASPPRSLLILPAAEG